MYNRVLYGENVNGRGDPIVLYTDVVISVSLTVTYVSWLYDNYTIYSGSSNQKYALCVMI